MPHIVQFLEELQGTATPALSSEELVELEQLRVKHEKLKAMKNKAGGMGAAAAQDSSNMAAAKKKKAKKSDSSEGSSSDSEVSSW